MVTAVTVCVDMDDLLALTLPVNRDRFDHYIVVTSPKDTATIQVAADCGDVTVLPTDAFYRDGAWFNKGAAINQALRMLHRGGQKENWVCLLDADIALPLEAGWLTPCLASGTLYAPAGRRMVLNPDESVRRHDTYWSRYPLQPDRPWVAGYTLLFDLAALKREDSIYPTDWKHAGGSDTDFCQRWPEDKRVLLPWEVLHLGPPQANWCGRTTGRIDGKASRLAEVHERAMKRMLQDRQTYGLRRERITPKGVE